MLKFQNNHTMVIATFEDFILTVYVVIDDLYRQFAPPDVTQRRHILDAKLSDPEIITIGICGELAGIDSENAWFSFVKRNYRYLFPNLCSRDSVKSRCLIFSARQECRFRISFNSRTYVILLETAIRNSRISSSFAYDTLK